jgi:Gpi18-like mannosyltransferase
MTYLFGARYFNRRIGFTAALFLAMTPVYREHVILAFTESLGALLLFAAFWSYLRRNRLWTVVLGSLCMLVKIDLIFLYFGTLILFEFWQWREQREKYDLDMQS